MAQKCMARSRAGLRCSQMTDGHSKWCSFHEEQQSKSLKTYKRYSAAYSDFVQGCECCDCAQLETQLSLEQLREVHAQCRKEWVLAGKAKEARVKHHDTFYCGGDCGHSQYINFLEQRQRDLEAMMLAVDEQAYSLIVNQETAGWLAENCDAPFSCCAGVLESTAESSLSDELSAGDLPELSDGSLTDSDDFKDKAISQENECARTSIGMASAREDPQDHPLSSVLKLSPPTPLDRLRTKFLSPDADHDAESLQHFQICAQIFRICVARTPSLLVRAQPFHDIAAFLQEDVLSSKDVKLLVAILKFPEGQSKGLVSPMLIRQAIIEATSCDNIHSSEQRVRVLGGFVGKQDSSGGMSLDQWKHLHSFIACSGCALSCAFNFEDWAKVKYDSLRSGAFRDWTSADQTSISKFGIACVSSHQNHGQTIERIKAKGKGMKTVWLEKEQRCWAVLRFCRTGINAQNICDAISQSSKHAVLLRNAETKECLGGPLKKDKSLWTERLRSGYSAADRKARSWTISTWFDKDDLLDRFSNHFPERRFNKHFTDTFEALVMASDSGVSWTAFESSLYALFEQLPTSQQENQPLSPQIVQHARMLFDAI